MRAGRAFVAKKPTMPTFLHKSIPRISRPRITHIRASTVLLELIGPYADVTNPIRGLGLSITRLVVVFLLSSKLIEALPVGLATAVFFLAALRFFS